MNGGPLLGVHMSISGGLEKALLRGRDLGCNTIQMFTKNASQWRERYLEESEIAEFKAVRKQVNINPVISHNSYLINLASADDELYEKSIDAMLHEMQRCELLGVNYLVIHPGSHRGHGEEYGIKKIAYALDRIQDRTRGYRVKIILEITAGQGTTLGYRLEQIARIITKVEESSRLAFCLDTCHAFAAGYELRTAEGYEGLLTEIEGMIGINKLKVIHVNDSKNDLGSRIDRHENIGKGMIGKKPFQWIMSDERLKDIPKILETPGFGKDLEKDRVNLDLLRSFVRL
jgi:deoxyribonuclease-4